MSLSTRSAVCPLSVLSIRRIEDRYTPRTQAQLRLLNSVRFETGEVPTIRQPINPTVIILNDPTTNNREIPSHEASSGSSNIRFPVQPVPEMPTRRPLQLPRFRHEDSFVDTTPNFRPAGEHTCRGHAFDANKDDIDSEGRSAYSSSYDSATGSSEEESCDSISPMSESSVDLSVATSNRIWMGVASIIRMRHSVNCDVVPLEESSDETSQAATEEAMAQTEL